MTAASADAATTAVPPRSGAEVARAVAPRPRILLVDAGRVIGEPVAAALRAHYDVRAVADSEGAWQAVLLDAAVRVVVIDVGSATSGGLDLLTRMRASRAQRVREMPAIALTAGVDEDESRRILAAESSELMLGTQSPAAVADELLVRLGVLVELTRTRDPLVNKHTPPGPARAVGAQTGLETELLALPSFDRQLDRLLSYARRALSDLALICICVELALPRSQQAWAGEINERMRLVGRTLASSIRLEDLVTRSDQTEFCVATQNNGMTDMLRFAARLRKVLENLDAAGPGVEVWTCVGVATLSEDLRNGAQELRALAQRRAQLAQGTRSRRIMMGAVDAAAMSGPGPTATNAAIDIGLALTLIESGRGAEVIPHLPRLLQQLNPLLRLVRAQQHIAAPTTAAASGSTSDKK